MFDRTADISAAEAARPVCVLLAGLLLLSVCAAPVRAAGEEASSDQKQSSAAQAANLQQATARMARTLADRTATKDVLVLPAGESALSGYAAAILPLYLESHSWSARPKDGREPPTAMRAPTLPDRLAKPLRTAFDGRGWVVLVKAQAPQEDAAGGLQAALYALESGRKAVSAREPFSLSSMEFLGSPPEAGWRSQERTWFRLLRRLFSAPDTDSLGFRERLAVAEGNYFFRAGYFAACAERLKDLAGTSSDSLLLRRVMALHMGGSTEEAKELLESAIKERPEAGPLYALKVWLVREQDVKNAVVLLGHARFSDVEHEGYYWCARALIARENGNEDRAERVLLKASQACPADPLVQLHVARFYWDDARLQEAVKHFRRALEGDPDNAEAWYELGMALDTAGKSDEAIEALRKAFELDPGRPHFSKRLSLLLERRGQYRPALDVLRNAADANPRSKDILSTYGDAAIHQWRIDEAQKAYRAALEADPGFLYARMRLAEIYRRQSNWKQAKQMLQGILKDHPEYVPAVVALGRLLTAQGHTQEAIEVLTKGATNLEQEVSRRLALCEAYLQAGTPKRAIRDAQIAVGARPDPLTYSMLARALMASDELSKAEMAAESALKAGNFSSEAHLTMARLLDARGKTEEALKECQKALELDPFSVEAMKLCGRLHRKNAQPERCAEVWQKALQLDRWDAELHWQQAELIRSELGQNKQAAEHYRRHLKLGGAKADRAARWLEKLDIAGSG